MLLESHPQTLLRATGDDAFGFLQGQFTNELRQAPGSATYGLWLNQKGKVLADSHVLRVSEKEFVIVSTASPAEIIRQRLEDYIVADDVTLADETGNAASLLVAGKGSREILQRVLGSAPEAGRFMSAAGLLVFSGRRSAEENFELVGPAEKIAALRQPLLAAGCAEATNADVEFARIAAGIPSVPADIGLGDLPNEGGLDDSAISYTKGCYLGQEVMARLKNLGQVRRRLHVVRGRGQPPAPATALYQGEKKVGEVRSSARRGEEFVALAMLSLINLQPNTDLSLEPGGAAALRIESHG